MLMNKNKMSNLTSSSRSTDLSEGHSDTNTTQSYLNIAQHIDIQEITHGGF